MSGSDKINMSSVSGKPPRSDAINTSVTNQASNNAVKGKKFQLKAVDVGNIYKSIKHAG